MEMVKVTDILNLVTESCDYGLVSDYPGETMDDKRTAFWQHVLQDKSSDSGFGNLVNSMLEHGWIEGSCVGWKQYSDDEYEISEGHHRLVYAILTGMDEVPVEYWGKCVEVNGERISAHWDENDPGHKQFLV